MAQVGTPRVLYEAPANLFVADFLGDSNLLPATDRAVSGGAHRGGDAGRRDLEVRAP